MSTFGTHMKITVDKSHRALVKRLFTEVLGCKAAEPRPDMDVFTFEDGFVLGAQSVEKSAALDPRDHMKAPWLEIAVDDPVRAREALAGLGITTFDYVDREHDYYCPPCGPVFRLAKR
jgi:hypothetical protein